jgi:hypothetical protein
MVRSKVPSDADLRVILLKRIAEYKRKQIPVPVLLRVFDKDVIGFKDRDIESLDPPSGHSREHAWERRSIEALREMGGPKGWIYVEYRGDETSSEALATEPLITRENKNSFVVTLMKRGQMFLEAKQNPPSNDLPPRSTQYRRVSQTPRNQSIADMVRSEEGKPRDLKSGAAARKRIAAAIAGRRGQQEFRQTLLQIYKRCLITGCDAEAVLEAAHIQPYSEAGTFDISNGLLLRADIHTLFDLGLLTIDVSDLTVITADSLKNTVYGALDMRKLCFPEGTEHRPDRGALHDHHLSFMRRQQKALEP